jgi:hypothetical protein
MVPLLIVKFKPILSGAFLCANLAVLVVIMALFGFIAQELSRNGQSRVAKNLPTKKIQTSC